MVSAAAADWRIEPEVALRAELLVSEIVSDAVDHGSDAATLRISLDDDKLELELFDGPRRSAIATNGRCRRACRSCATGCWRRSPTVATRATSARVTTRAYEIRSS